MIWDDHQNRCIGELSFRSEVKSVRMSRERVVVVLEYRVYVYNFADLNLLHTIETTSNPHGITELCADSRSCVLVSCGLTKGHVRVELFDMPRTTHIAAHDSALSCLALNRDGSLLATASERGTLVRVWDTRTGQRLYELRRGAEPAEIQCLSFNNPSTMLLVGSDHGTVHLFRLANDKANERADAEPSAEPSAEPPTPAAAGADVEALASKENPRSSFAFLSGLLPRSLTPSYIQSQWSFAQFRCFFSHSTHFSHMSEPIFPISHLLNSFLGCRARRRRPQGSSAPLEPMSAASSCSGQVHATPHTPHHDHPPR